MISASSLFPKQVDLNACDKEEIQFIQNIQDHGALVIIELTSNRVVAKSEGIEKYLSLKQTLILDKPFGEEFADLDLQKMIDLTSFGKPKFDVVTIANRQFTAIYHQVEKHLFIEFELANPSKGAYNQQAELSEIFAQLHTVDTDADMCNTAAKLIKNFTGYDRVMIYKFDEDWNGTVISEEKNASMESWLGVKYPATDIPQQARCLFLKQGVRLIGNINSKPLNIITNSKIRFDLSNCEFRSVSPVHIEYLSNMEVAATLTAAIIYKEQLWGLIACHNTTPKVVDYYQRSSCKFLAQVFSAQLGLRSSNTVLEKINNKNKVRATLVEQMSSSTNIVDGLTLKEAPLLNLVEASGAAVYFDGVLKRIGDTPPETAILELLRNINNTENDLFYTHNASQYFKNSETYKDIASGVLCAFISRSKADAILWFKPEKLKNVIWGGNIELEAKNHTDERISPRKSFKKWASQQKGCSEPWDDADLSAAVELKKNISEIILKKYDEIKKLNENLKNAYNELESFSYSVSHDLRAPLRGIDGFAQILKEDYYQSLDAYGKSAINTIIKSTNKMNTLIDDILSFSGLGKKNINVSLFKFDRLVMDVIQFINTKTLYPHSIINIEPNLGKIKGDRPMIFQLMYNLITNGLKYSAECNKPKITIGKENECYYVRDNGIGFNQKHANKIFGVFNRLVGDEYEGSGIGLSISKRVVEKHQGKIWAISEEGVGSTFYFSINDLLIE
jgi:light-regulated signal transduction histidine kinase (bacteriophytochrome)